MQSSNLPFSVWYKTMFLLNRTKKGFSIKGIQRQLSLKCYESVWGIVHKLCKSINNGGIRYALEGMVELHKGYFTMKSPVIKKVESGWGRNTKAKSNVASIAGFTTLENVDSGKKSTQSRCINAKVLVEHEVDPNVQESPGNNIILTEKINSYVNRSNYIELHLTVKSSEQTSKEGLKWEQITINYTKGSLLGIYRKTRSKYLQLYLNEFIYRLKNLFTIKHCVRIHMKSH